ncbi:unnamed protein product [Rotaria magnacalcarata]|uniref:Uncharacterized protein n=1 Tax=Rotaria magnacalcarata TaxID=392030 RepID=A0A816YY22_9BILA|nr:unnamed protein product [Rotaria magnacalcarata]CAF1407455.1 unnamed protein product [Rotaria magnacalcarata]CAF2093437.1 unnamed protein product [Rotaria magnacalcarata]CAF2175726.1 unnamed protein product [Rotaria magnacalcarata]CAF3744179.1 unnamed protein product [Rotaria magnacalcarata]
MYHAVRIRDLTPVPPKDKALQNDNWRKQADSFMPSQFWERSLNDALAHDNSYYDSNEGKYRQTYFEVNVPHAHIIYSGHPLFEAYLAADNAHKDLILSSDDI